MVVCDERGRSGYQVADDANAYEWFLRSSARRLLERPPIDSSLGDAQLRQLLDHPFERIALYNRRRTIT
jgi:hypothetical protein